MKLPGILELCRFNEVKMVCGSYALPVWEWAQRNVRGASYTIDEVVSDPDEVSSPWCPGFGKKAMWPAFEHVKAQRPVERVLGDQELDWGYWKRWTLVLNNDYNVEAKTVVQPYTRHSWKNCDDVISTARFALPVTCVGLPDEPAREDWKKAESFDVSCREILTCQGFVGVLSAWSNFAALFERPQIVVSFTDDVPLVVNPNATVLVKPSLEQLQTEIERRQL